MPVKQTTVEQVNIDKCVEAFNGNRFKLIIDAAKRAREIANARAIADRAAVKPKYENKPVVAALREIGDGRLRKGLTS